MNVQERLERELVNRGLNLKDSAKIINLSLPEINKQAREVNGVDEDDKPINPYTITWDRPYTEYDEFMYNIWFSSVVKSEALKWITKNAPEAWFKKMFE